MTIAVLGQRVRLDKRDVPRDPPRGPPRGKSFHLSPHRY